ncbi:MAG: nucleotide exchange factor GrpE [Patescibacteria group bacterium]|nr:nucleotide exchange factor GrpE [Patescibacteria group bacterium]
MVEDKKYPETVVAAVIYNDQGEIFLTKSSKWGEYWQIPGGHVEPGESCVDALKREIREETGLEVDNLKLNDLQDCVYPKEFARKAHFVFLDYSAHLAGGELAEKNREMEEYQWIKPEQALKELKLNPYTKISMEKFMENRKNDYAGLYKRALADYQNLLKQTAKEKMEFAIYANEIMLKEILPVYDHLKMAIEHHHGEAADEWLTGVKHVVKQFKDVLEKIGVMEIKTIGEKFDHTSMEAIKNEETDDEKLDGLVASQMKAGYKLNGKVIEAAKVVVYKMKS